MDIYKQTALPKSELDFCSPSFNAIGALNSHSVPLPYPKAKTYNNLAEYYTHTFLKKDKKSESDKERSYDRDYSYYYATLGLDKEAQKMFEQRIMKKKKKYMGWRTAKMRKYIRKFNDDSEPCRSYEPLKSTKIIQLQSVFSKYKIIVKEDVSYHDSEINIEKEMGNSDQPDMVNSLLSTDVTESSVV